MRRHPLIAFFALAYAISWMLWLPRVNGVVGLWSAPRPTSPLWHLAGSLGPAMAAVVVTRATGGARGLRELRSRLMRWRVGAVPWAVAVLGPLGIYAGAALAMAVTGGPLPDVRRIAQVDEYPSLGPLAVLAVEIVAYGYGEESGWRGFAQRRLEARWGTRGAVLVLSVLWALWHLPLLLTNTTYRAMDALGLLGWYASLLAGAALMAWLYDRARGSVLVVAVFHGLLDVVMVNAGVRPAMVPLMGAVVTIAGIAAFVLATGDPTPDGDLPV